MAGPTKRRKADLPMRPFSQSLPMALLRAREATMRSFRPMLSEHDVTEQQWRVLRALAAEDDGLEVRELADQTFLLGPSLSRILANLERRRLIRRLAVATDQRKARIMLAPTGQRLVRTIAPRSEARYQQIESEFGAKNLRRLLAMLDDLSAVELGVDDDLDHTALDDTDEVAS